MKIDNSKKPDSLKGIKSKKVKNKDIQVSYLHSEFVSGSVVSMQDGSLYDVMKDGSWVKRTD